MAKALLLNRENLPALKERLEVLTPESERKFGKLTPEGMLAHLTKTLEISLGQCEFEDISNPITRTRAFRWLFLETLPWPKGKLKAPDYFTPDADGTIEEERARLFAKAEEFIEALEKDPERIQPTPGFGPVTLAYWSKFHGLHFDHHFKQFNI